MNFYKMLMLINLLTTLCVATKITVNPTIINDLDESYNYQVSFQLSSPIQCENPHVLCNVVLTFTNPEPDEISIEPCIIEWSRDEWQETKTVTISALEDFIDDGERTITLVTNPLISHAIFYEDVNPEDITVRTRSRPSGHCSSTGDPHYNTFDGRYYHFYGRGYVLMTRSISRDFEVQAITHGGGYSRNCAVAARENNDLVIFDACDGSFEITERITSTGSARPIIYQRGGNQYVVDFASGARVQAHTWGSNMNVYIDVPGADWDNTYGMCGTFDGNSNNDGNPSYVIHSYSALPSNWKIDSSTSLWNWRPTVQEDDSSNQESQESHTCNYTRPLTHRPIIRTANVEDITDLIIETRQRNTDDLDQGKNYTFEPRDDDIVPETISEEDATILCNQRFGDDTVALCINLANINLDRFINNCIEDLVQMGDEAFLEDSYQDLIQECEQRIIANQTILQVRSGAVETITNLCIDGCSRFGSCQNGECVCQEGYGGSDCLVNIIEDPQVNSIYPDKCDLNHPEECTNYIRVSGSNFLNSDDLTCHYQAFYDTYSRTWTQLGRYMGYSTVMCPTPNQTEIPTVVNMDVSNHGYVEGDGLLGQTLEYVEESYMEYLSRVPSMPTELTWYDGVCNQCSGTMCHFKENACHFNNTHSDSDLPMWRKSVCVASYERSPDNECLLCRPSVSQTNWTYDTTSLMCKPKFVFREMMVNVLEAYFDIHDQLEFSNQFVPNQFYNVTYGYSGDYPFFSLNSITGEYRINGVFDYESEQSYLIPIYLLTDNTVVDTFNLMISVIDVNEPPVFSQDSYHFTIYYNSTNNRFNYTNELVITAIEPDFLSGDSVTYRLNSLNMDQLFDINSETGEITVNENNLPDYLNDDMVTFELNVQAFDQNGNGIETDVEIDVVTYQQDQEPTSDSIVDTTEAITNETGHFVDNQEDYLTDSPDTVETTQSIETTVEPTSNLDSVDLGDFVDNPVESSKSNESTDATGMIVGIISGILLVILFVGYKYYQSSYKTIFDDKLNDSNYEQPVIESRMYANPVYGEVEKLEDKYDWYFSSLTDKQCQEKLKDKAQGSFLVSNYQDNLVARFFVIKYDNKLIKQDIVFDSSHGYYLYGITNPEYFQTIAALVEYYSEPKKDFPYKLVGGMPIYDNLLLRYYPHANKPATKVKQDPNAPELPSKQKNNSIYETMA